MSTFEQFDTGEHAFDVFEMPVRSFSELDVVSLVGMRDVISSMVSEDQRRIDLGAPSRHGTTAEDADDLMRIEREISLRIPSDASSLFEADKPADALPKIDSQEAQARAKLLGKVGTRLQRLSWRLGFMELPELMEATEPAFQQLIRRSVRELKDREES